MALSRFVGRLNPAAVEACLRTGGKIVWMPTIDTDGHAQAHGQTGGYEAQGADLSGTPRGISIFDEVGKIWPAVYEILDLVKEVGAILATAHLSAVEIVALVPAALARGLRKVVITHPFFKTPALNLSTLAGLVEQGAYAEFAYNTVSPMWRCASIAQVRAAIARMGAQGCLLVSDGGQRHNPTPPEGLRIFAQSLFELGVTEAECRSDDVQQSPRPPWAGRV